MSLVSGPGRGGNSAMPDELKLVIDNHVTYIQSLDKVHHLLPHRMTEEAHALTAPR